MKLGLMAIGFGSTLRVDIKMIEHAESLGFDSAWTAEALKNTIPASVFSRSTECHNQDKVSMGTIAARDCMRVLQLTEQVAAAALLAMTQWINLRISQDELCPSSLTPSLAKTLDQVRADFELLTEDRPLESVLRQTVDKIQAGEWEVCS